MKIKHNLLINTIVGVLFTFSIVYFFGSLYDTADDLTMRNISFNNSWELMWSKAIYGKILLLFPVYVFGFARYDFLIFILLGLNLGLLLNALSKLLAVSNAHKYFYFALISLVYVQFLIRPQFTNTAGLLAITGILNIFVYIKVESNKSLYIGLTLLLFSYWIRLEMTVVISFIFLPFLWFFRKKWQIILTKNTFLSFLFFLGLLFLTFVVEKESYTSRYHKIRDNRVQVVSPFFDYSFGRKLLKSSNVDILNASTLSNNDVKLFDAHFFDWPQFDTLIPYLGKVEKWYFDERDYKSSRLLSAKLSFVYFKEYEVFFLALAILFFYLLNVLKTDRKVLFFISVSIFFAVFVFGWYGYIQRAFLSRLYLTPLFGLIVLMIAFIANGSTKLSKVVLAILLIANTTYQTSIHIRRVQDAKKTNVDWAKFRNNHLEASRIVVWGGGPDLIYLNPVHVSGIKKSGDEILQGVGYVCDLHNKYTPTNRLLNGEVVYYAINPDNFILLKTFFKEKFSKDLIIESVDKKFSICKVSMTVTK